MPPAHRSARAAIRPPDPDPVTRDTPDAHPLPDVKALIRQIVNGLHGQGFDACRQLMDAVVTSGLWPDDLLDAARSEAWQAGHGTLLGPLLAVGTDLPFAVDLGDRASAAQFACLVECLPEDTAIAPLALHGALPEEASADQVARLFIHPYLRSLNLVEPGVSIDHLQHLQHTLTHRPSSLTRLRWVDIDECLVDPAVADIIRALPALESLHIGFTEEGWYDAQVRPQALDALVQVLLDKPLQSLVLRAGEALPRRLADRMAHGFLPPWRGVGLSDIDLQATDARPLLQAGRFLALGIASHRVQTLVLHAESTDPHDSAEPAALPDHHGIERFVAAIGEALGQRQHPLAVLLRHCDDAQALAVLLRCISEGFNSNTAPGCVRELRVELLPLVNGITDDGSDAESDPDALPELAPSEQQLALVARAVTRLHRLEQLHLSFLSPAGERCDALELGDEAVNAIVPSLRTARLTALTFDGPRLTRVPVALLQYQQRAAQRQIVALLHRQAARFGVGVFAPESGLPADIGAHLAHWLQQVDPGLQPGHEWPVLNRTHLMRVTEAYRAAARQHNRQRPPDAPDVPLDHPLQAVAALMAANGFQTSPNHD